MHWASFRLIHLFPAPTAITWRTASLGSVLPELSAQWRPIDLWSNKEIARIVLTTRRRPKQRQTPLTHNRVRACAPKQQSLFTEEVSSVVGLDKGVQVRAASERYV